jgi:hypothetical protein
MGEAGRDASGPSGMGSWQLVARGDCGVRPWVIIFGVYTRTYVLVKKKRGEAVLAKLDEFGY